MFAALCRANAEANGSKVVKVETFMEELREHRGAGFVECADFDSECERVLAVQLRPLVGGPVAIGLGLESSRLPGERGRLLQLLAGVAKKIEGDGVTASIDQSLRQRLALRRRLTRSGANGSIRCLLIRLPTPTRVQLPRNTKSRI